MTKPVPVRTCVGCRSRRPWHELTRLARSADGRLGLGRHALGRGAWLCGDRRECAERATRAGSLTRALRAPRSDAAALAELAAARSSAVGSTETFSGSGR